MTQIRKLKKILELNLKKSFLSSFSILVIFVFSSCGTTKLYYVKSTPKQDEISISPELKQFLDKKKGKQLAVVLRTPRAISDVTQESQNGEIYNSIERGLMNAGFLVRDRALLERLLVSEQLSYESIAEKIKVDLIIEVLETSNTNNFITEMFRKKNNKRTFVGATQLNAITSKISFRITLAETGVTCGFFTFYYVPCSEGCDIYADKFLGSYWFTSCKTSTMSGVGMWSFYIKTDDIIKDLPNKIINILHGK